MGSAKATAGATLIAGPVQVKAYKLTLTASGTSLTLIFTRTAGAATQMHMYSFAIPAGALKVKSDLSQATLKPATSLGPFGKITVTFEHPGKLSVTRAPAPCTGSTKGRTGTLVGPFSFVADGGTYFGTIKKSSVPARLLASTAGISCGGTTKPSGQSGLTLMAGLDSGGAQMFFATKAATGKASETMLVTEQRAPAQIMHSIVASVVATAFTAAGDLSSARVDAAPAGPMLGGALGFTAVTPAVSAGACRMATGEMSSTLAAHFDSIGDRGIEDGSMGTLTSCG